MSNVFNMEKSPIRPISVRMSIEAKRFPNKILINWLNNEVKELASYDDFIFYSLTMKEALQKSIMIYEMNKKNIKKIIIEQT